MLTHDNPRLRAAFADRLTSAPRESFYGDYERMIPLRSRSRMPRPSTPGEVWNLVSTQLQSRQ